MHDLRLALFVGASDAILPLADVLALPSAERARLGLSPRWAAISLVVDGEEKWGPRLSIGPFAPLVPQLLPAAERLARGERAVLYFGPGDGPNSELVVFSPDGDRVEAALCATDAIPRHEWLADGVPSPALYAFVDANLPALVALGVAMRDQAPVHVDRAALVAALKREADVGARALAALPA